MPEVVEEVLQRAADAPVVIWCPEHEHIGRLDARLHARKGGRFVGRVRIVQGQRFDAQVEQVGCAAGGGEPGRHLVQHHARCGMFPQAAHHQQDSQRSVGHASRTVPKGGTGAKSSLASLPDLRLGLKQGITSAPDLRALEG
ncbi:MAG: hypothetical protein M5U12_26400 [Verrucomicrobia bacterium]|nr:hypothetical protein [Verrucomicrobiota bacterium]